MSRKYGSPNVVLPFVVPIPAFIHVFNVNLGIKPDNAINGLSNIENSVTHLCLFPDRVKWRNPADLRQKF